MSKDKESSYYDAGGIEVLDVIKAKLTPEQYEGYLLGNSIKYQLRFNFKTIGVGRIRDAVKAKNYSAWLVEFLEECKSDEKISNYKKEYDDWLKDIHIRQTSIEGTFDYKGGTANNGESLRRKRGTAE